ncbi:MAG: hypothetical protein HZA92_04725 [Verrucomicrobia bacterium]|nr:hypothetical protein [Verrucomicrobiota bacterium]
MSVNSWKPASLPLPAVWLDGQQVELPVPSVSSLAAIFSELETLAASRQRVLSAVWVDGTPAELVVRQLSGGLFQRVEAESISLEELSRRLAVETRSQVRELRWAVERAVLTVLINDPPQNRRLWQQWQGAIRAPLAKLGLLHDLWGARLSEMSAGGHTLDAHLEELGRIASHIELVLLKPDVESQPAAMILSNLFERSLGPWLRRLEDYLGKLHEQTLE